MIKRQQELGKVREIGKITRWYSRSKACKAKVFSCQLSVGDRFYLVSQTKAHCQLVTLQGIKVTEHGEDIGKEFIEVTSEIEVGLKFDADGKKALLLYLTELD